MGLAGGLWRHSLGRTSQSAEEELPLIHCLRRTLATTRHECNRGSGGSQWARIEPGAAITGGARLGVFARTALPARVCFISYCPRVVAIHPIGFRDGLICVAAAAASPTSTAKPAHRELRHHVVTHIFCPVRSHSMFFHRLPLARCGSYPFPFLKHFLRTQPRTCRASHLR